MTSRRNWLAACAPGVWNVALPNANASVLPGAAACPAVCEARKWGPQASFEPLDKSSLAICEHQQDRAVRGFHAERASTKPGQPRINTSWNADGSHVPTSPASSAPPHG